jgi:hypothetical protein
VNRFDDPLGGGNWISGERNPGTVTGDYLLDNDSHGTFFDIQPDFLPIE